MMHQKWHTFVSVLTTVLPLVNVLCVVSCMHIKEEKEEEEEGVDKKQSSLPVSAK